MRTGWTLKNFFGKNFFFSQVQTGALRCLGRPKGLLMRTGRTLKNFIGKKKNYFFARPSGTAVPRVGRSEQPDRRDSWSSLKEIHSAMVTEVTTAVGPSQPERQSCLTGVALIVTSFQRRARKCGISADLTNLTGGTRGVPR
jgi:hypothetical protein